MTHRYSLADYTCKITLPDNLYTNEGVSLAGKVITLGGPGKTGIEGSFVGSIAVSRSADMWSTEGDPTGSWTHTKNLNRTGSVAISLSQISNDIVLLNMIAAIYENDTYQNTGMSIKVFRNDTIVANCEDCYITRVPSQDFGSTAAMQTWTLTAGRVTFPMTTSWDAENIN